ncbi:MAG: alpha/beta hydrolase [Sphingomonas sp.]|uniref:alpha/beta fold hydrolase n=1 Tax=Sphingomonas sp. TaxID=28214 RepID=UPI001B05F32F|nr:alpha/beta hydrolase [Sphingomonas sp.]MBO9623927.1 alpha/beta hydrolase [Sphingomonas sp.]
MQTFIPKSPHHRWGATDEIGIFASGISIAPCETPQIERGDANCSTLTKWMTMVISRFIAGMMLAVSPGIALAQSASGATLPASAPRGEALAQYARPHERVDIGSGRKLNLFCMGTGSHTVLFDSGLSDWSVVWALVQPEVAKRTRACSYDRAGMGYSDPARGPRSPMAIAADIHALVQAAKLETPLVLVGHSLGGFNVKLYAALYPEDVAGLVLVDPSQERTYDRLREHLRNRAGDALAARMELGDADSIKRATARYADCATAARTAELDPTTDLYKRCTDPVIPALGETIAAERISLQVTSAYQDAQASELANSVYGDTRGDEAYRYLFSGQRFGAKPLIVLTHGNFDASDPREAADYDGAVWLDQETAALSSRGRQRVVPGTDHYIELDAPGSVVDAIFEVLNDLEED